MTNQYNKIIYDNREKSIYPQQLAKYLHREYVWSNGHPKLLDVGCGDKTFMKEFEKLELKCTGIDYPEIDFDNDRLPYEDETFDYIFCKSVIEHVRNTDLFVSEMRRVLKKNGMIIILTPSWEHVYKDFYHDYTHVKPFTIKALRDCLKIHHFKHIDVQYFHQLPFLWGNTCFLPIVNLVKLLPDSWKWKDKEQTRHNKFIRFSKEVMLLATGCK